MTLKLVESLKASIEELDRLEAPCECADGIGLAPKDKADHLCEIIDFEVQRAGRCGLKASEVSPETILKMALEDVEKFSVKKAYVTLIIQDESGGATACYRAGLSKVEEVAYRQLGVADALVAWREGGEN